MSPTSNSTISEMPFGNLPDGREATLFTLTNATGMVVKITNYGGAITSIVVPDKNGVMGEVVLGYDSVEEYVAGNPFFGVIAGRYANRIAKGSFSIGDETYTLAVNNGENHLHGGTEGFDKKLWAAESFQNESGVGVVLSYVSPDGEEGYPGTLTSKVTYTLTPANAIQIDYEATTDKSTVVNLTNHSYFNLKDGGASSMLDHKMRIVADQYIPTDAGNIPLGPLADVEGTPFDFRTSTALGARIEGDHEQLAYGFGYDHTYVINGEEGALNLAAEVFEESTGRFMEVLTNEPGVQLYTGNHLNGNFVGRGTITYASRSGFCLETQRYPDTPNQPDYPSAQLNPGETYETTTIYRFSTR
ncbi:MAG: aldose epimerase family protein [Rhodothermales bacterium]